MNKLYTIALLLLLHTLMLTGQTTRTDANVTGHVICKGEHIPFATVIIKGSTIGTMTNETGHYNLINLPAGTHIIRVQALGYGPMEKEIKIKNNITLEVNFDISEDILGLEEVVITGNRNEKDRSSSSVIVNTISPKIFSASQSVTLGEGLNFTPGLRMENNCQNCGFNQVRMNGLEGPYSQILINSKPVFGGLAGVYGLELIPSNMIERIEVVRGGGSALYGSNAIAGTINLILKDPITNSYETGMSYTLTGAGVKEAGDPAPDFNITFNSSAVSGDNKTGMSLYGFYRDRSPWDSNNDGYSELTSISNKTIGSRLFHRFGFRSKISGDLFVISEKRRGGNGFGEPLHTSDISEAVEHNMISGAVTYDQFFRETDLWSVYVSGMSVTRDSYYGASRSLKDYGITDETDYSVGTQYTGHFKSGTLTTGAEVRGAKLNDRKLSYQDFDNAVIENDSIVSIPIAPGTEIADQKTLTTGLFAQYEAELGNLNVSAGMRYDRYSVSDNSNSGNNNSGNVFSPRITFRYDFNGRAQLRTSYSQGYRAPQIFDEDLHIETSGLRKVIHRNSPDLKQETSHSWMLSATYNFSTSTFMSDMLMELFSTRLLDPFTNEFGEPDENNIATYTRINAEGGATVAGVNVELNVASIKGLNIESGFTAQISRYDNPQEFNSDEMLRTPATYGYITVRSTPTSKISLSATGNYTGTMLIPYFGLNQPDPGEGELRKSDPFFDIGVKGSYTIKINGASLQLYTGIKNIFNSYQSDADRGVRRDPGYMYGPGNPRMIYFGMKIGNILN
ncbi:MAG: TonB-dependent receptor [Bacteroidales bacterium]|nr:TonB-dependent receptor [Bacteroidales bacterium]